MRTSPALRNTIVTVIATLIIYTLADGIRYGSTWGIIMAVMSLLAFLISINLVRKLSRLKEEEEKQSQ